MQQVYLEAMAEGTADGCGRLHAIRRVIYTYTIVLTAVRCPKDGVAHRGRRVAALHRCCFTSDSAPGGLPFPASLGQSF